MQNELRVLAQLLVFILMGSISTLHAAGHIPPEDTVSDNQNNAHCVQGYGTQIEVIKLNYVKAEDAAKVLTPLFSQHARIIPYEPANSVIIKYRGRVCEEPE